MFKKVSQQTVWQIFGKFVTSVSTVIVLGIVARSFGVEGTGVFTLALTYLAVFYLLADFGFNAHFLQEFQLLSPKDQSLQWRKLFGARLFWSVCLVLVATLSLPLWPFSNQLFVSLVLPGSVAIVASGIFVTTNLIFQSRLKYELSVAATSIGTLVSLGLVLLGIYQDLPLAFLVFAHALGWIVIALLALLFVKRYISNPLPIFDPQFAVNLLRNSWPIAATLTLNVVYFRADSFLLSIFQGNEAVGIYNVAYSLFQAALVLPTFVMNAYYPMMINVYTANKTLLRSQLYVVGAVLLSFAIIGAIFTLIVAPLVIYLITGGGFEGSTPTLRILSLGFPGYFISALLMWLLVLQKRYKTILVVYLVGLLVNVISNIFFIPVYSYIAAAWITVASEYLIVALQLLIIGKPEKDRYFSL